MSSVGSASFRFSGDLSELRKDLGKVPGLAAGAAKEIDRALGGGFAGASREASQLAEKIEALSAKRLKLEASIDVNRSSLDNVTAEIAKINQQRIALKTDSTETKAKLQEVNKEIEALKLKKIQLSADTSVPASKIKALDQQLAGLDKQKITLELSDRQAKEKVGELNRKLQSLVTKRLKIEADVSAAQTGVKSLTGQIGQLESKLNNSGQAAQRFGSIYQGVLQGVGQQLTVLAQRAAIAPFAAIGGAIGGFKEFDAQLQQFSALTGKAREDLGPLNAEIERLGLETSKSPVEVAQTANALITLGAAADGVKDQLSGVVSLSEATRTGLELSGQVVQTVQNVFGESSDDIADKLTVLRNNTASSVEDVLQLASKAGGVGVAVGEDFNTLAAAFATLRDGGFTAETAATALKISLLALTAPNKRQTKAFDELGVSAFDAAGKFKGIEAILPELAASVAGLSDEDRSGKLKRAFGSEALPAVILLLDKFDTRMAETKARLEDFEGTAAKSSATLIEGFAGSGQLLQGSVEALGVEFGANLEPALTAGTLAINDIVSEVLNSEGLFDEMAASAQGFSDTLKDNPENIKQISGAVVGVVREVQSEIANVLNFLSDFLDDSERVDGLADSIAGIGATIRILGDIVSTLAPLINLVAGNSELFGLALQVILVRMIAIKALGFAGAIASMVTSLASTAGATSAASLGMTGFGAATAGATSGLGAFGLAATAALGPLAVLVAAVAAAKFIKFSQDLRVANEELEAVAGGSGVVADQALQTANKLKNVTDQIAAARRDGVQVSDEQIQRAAQLKVLAEEQLKALKEQIAEANRLEPKNEAQENSKTALIAGLKVSEGALNKQIEGIDLAITPVVNGAALEEALPEDATVEVDADTDEAEDALADLQAASAEALSQIQQDANARIKAVREAQLAGVKGEEEAAGAIAQIQADSLKEELAQKQAQLAELAKITPVAATPGSDDDEDEEDDGGTVGNAEAIGQEKLKLEQEISQLSLNVVEAEVEEKKKLREKELADLKRVNAQAEAAIERSQQERIIGIRQSQLSGGLDEEQAAQRIAQVEQDSLRETLALKQAQLAQVTQLESRGLLTAEESADQQIALNEEIGRLNLEQIEKEIAAQKDLSEARKKAALDNIQNTLGVDAENLGLDVQRGQGQLALLGAQAELQGVLGALEQGRLETQLASAEAAGDVAGAERLRSRLIDQQSQQFEQQAKLQQAQLFLQQKIQRIELERAKLGAEIALAEAEANGESERVLGLRRQQVQLATEAIAQQAEIEQAQRDGLSAQQAVTREQEKQARLSDEQSQKERERARLLGIISGQLNETDQVQAEAALENAEKRFDLATGAGLTSQADRQAFSGARRDVENLVEGGASDEELLRAAITQRDNSVFQQLLKDIGRGDIADLAALSPVTSAASEGLKPIALQQDAVGAQLSQVQAGGQPTGLDAVGAQIVREIQAVRSLLEQNLARPYQLNVQTKEDPGLAAAGIYAEQQKAALAALGA